jgi:O-methyltransferase
MLDELEVYAKYLLARVLYRYPPSSLHPASLGIYLNELILRANVEGDVAEVGCSAGGTACLASTVVRNYSQGKRYLCYDTFSGFVPAQFNADLGRGTPEESRRIFAKNSEYLVRRILDIHHCQDVRLIRGDICKIPDDNFSDRYSVVLMDVDLEEPTYVGLKRFYPRLTQGGIIFVDDCRQVKSQRWRAFQGFSRFCAEHNLEPRTYCGFGVVEKGEQTSRLSPRS